MEKCTVLLTCVGGLISPSQIDSFKNNPDKRKVKIIGVDTRKDAIGRYMVDEFYKVPPGDSSGYVKTVLKICKREKVDVIFPASNEEALALAKKRELFKNWRVVIAVSDYKVLRLAFNKASAYSLLLKHNLGLQHSYLPGNYNTQLQN